MSQQNFLSNVIRRVEKAEAATKAKSSYSTEKVIVIDKRTGEIQSKVPAISFGGNLSYYVVSNDPSTFSDPRELEVEVTDFANDRKLGLSVTYRASYEADKSSNEEKIVKALYNNNSLEAELDKKIERWVIEFSRDRIADFIDNYFDEIKKLQNYLQTKAKNEVGLRLELRISPIQTEDAPNLVFSNRDASNIAEHSGLIIEVKDIANNRRLDISIAYRASYDPLDREKVAQQLFTTGKPLKDEIDKKLKYWVNAHLRGSEGEFIDLYLERVTKLEQDLVNIARAETGIQLDLNITLNKQVKTIIIPSRENKVRVSDSDEELDLTIQTELLVIDPIKASYLDINGDIKWGEIQLVNLLMFEIKKYLQENTKVTEFYYELKDKVRNNLVNYLNKKLADKGRKISYLHLDSKIANSSPAPQELIEIQYLVECKVQNYPKLIPVENTLQMLPQDVKRYISAQSPNLPVWVESKLEKIIKPLLLAKKYIDILSEFETVSNQIRQEMGKEAESIGYKIEHIVSIPRLAHLDLKTDFEIQNKNEEFSTNAANIKVKLTTIVNARFDDFKGVEQYLDRDVNKIKEEMQKVVNAATREVLHQILPESFYMYFYSGTTGKGESVEEKLQERIATALTNRFGVVVIGVTPKTEETNIIEYLQKLIGITDNKFECTIDSTTGAESATLNGSFKIVRIEDGYWNTFQSVFLSTQQSQQRLWNELKGLNIKHSELLAEGDIQNNRVEIDRIDERIKDIENEIFGLDKIRNCIQESIATNLFGIFDSPTLQYASPEDRNAISQEMNNWASKSVRNQYGLEISLFNIRRSQTNVEKYAQRVTQAKIEATFTQSINQIEECRKQDQIKMEAQTIKIQKQLSMSSNIYDDKENRLKALRDTRTNFEITDADKEDLEVVEKKIKTLEEEIDNLAIPGDQGELIDLNLLKLKQSKPSSFLEAKKQKSLPSDINNQDSESKGNTEIKDIDDRDDW
jgi:hypothetical protein